MVEIGRVSLALDPQSLDGGGEGFIDAGVVPVDDNEDRAVAVGQAAENGRGELRQGQKGSPVTMMHMSKSKLGIDTLVNWA